MSVRYLKHCTPRITDIAKRLSNLWETKRTLIPQHACFEIEADFQLATMVRSAYRVFRTDSNRLRSRMLSRPLSSAIPSEVFEALMKLSISRLLPFLSTTKEPHTSSSHMCPFTMQSGSCSWCVHPVQVSLDGHSEFEIDPGDGGSRSLATSQDHILVHPSS